jgi:hypothetical protein
MPCLADDINQRRNVVKVAKLLPRPLGSAGTCWPPHATVPEEHEETVTAETLAALLSKSKLN